MFVLLDIFETLNEMAFVVQIIVFSYLLFWLYLTFRESQLLFGVSAALAGYIIFLHGVSVTILVAVFVFIVLFGMQFQQLIWFGLGPLFGYHAGSGRFMHETEMDPRKQQQKVIDVSGKIENGTASQQEIEWMEQHQMQQQMGGGGASPQLEMQRRLMMGGG